MQSNQKEYLLEKIQKLVSEFNNQEYDTPTKRRINLNFNQQEINAFELMKYNQAKFQQQKRATEIKKKISLNRNLIEEQEGKEIDQQLEQNVNNQEGNVEKQSKLEQKSENKLNRQVYSTKFKENVLAYSKDNSIIKASILYNVPCDTIKNWREKELKNQDLEDQRKRNKRPIKYAEVENTLLKKVIEFRVKQLPISYNKLILLSQEVANSLNENNFKCSYNWMSGFINRNNLKLKKKSTTSNILPDELQNRAYKYILDCKEQKYYSKYDIILNMDESPFFLSNSTLYTYDLKQQKRISIVNSDNKQKITICLTMGVNTKTNTSIKIKPYFILKNKHQNPYTIKKLQNTYLKHCYIDYTSSGWQTLESMQRYSEFLIKQIKLTQIGNPRVLLVLDTYKVHQNSKIITNLSDSGVDTLFIPGGTTSLLQPMDVSILKPIKQNVKKQFTEWQFQIIQQNLKANKSPDYEIFINWALKSIDEVDDNVIIRSFECTGLTLEMDKLSIGLLSTLLKDLFYELIKRIEELIGEDELIQDPYIDQYQLEIQDIFFNDVYIEEAFKLQKQ